MMKNRNDNKEMSTLSLKILLCLPLFVTSVRGLTSSQPPKAKQNNIKSSAMNRAPGPTKWPVVGTLPHFLGSGGPDEMITMHEDLYKEYGMFYSYSILGDDETVVCDPSIFEEGVLKREGRFPFGGAQLSPVFKDFYKSIGSQELVDMSGGGKEWKESRQKLNPDIFAAGNEYLPLIADAASTASKVLGEQINGSNNTPKVSFEDFISRMAFDMFSSVVYGESPKTVDGNNVDKEDLNFVTTSQKAFSLSGQMMLDPMAKTFKTGKYAEFTESMEKSFTFSTARTSEYIKLARQKQQREATTDTLGGSSNANIAVENGSRNIAAPTVASKCPIQTMKSAATNLGQDMNDGLSRSTSSVVERLMARGQLEDMSIANNIGALLMAGVDTTAYIMSWLYLNLASNLDAQKKLAQELDTVLGGDDLTTVEQLESLPYLHACVRESHRLNPVTAQVVIKRLDFDISMGGYDVKAGSKVSLNIRGIPMDPMFVDKPNEYRPERFLPEAIEARRGTPKELLDHKLFHDPFGAGKRVCLGQRVAVHEIMSQAARLFQDWEILLEDKNATWKTKQLLMMKAFPYPDMKAVSRIKETQRP